MRKVELLINDSLYDRLFMYAQRRTVLTNEAITLMIRHFVDGTCPFCGGNVERSYKHADLELDENDRNRPYGDVEIYRCNDCGKFHGDVENFIS